MHSMASNWSRFMTIGQTTTIEITRRLIEKLASTDPRIVELNRAPIPSISAIVEIIETMNQLLFPGFCDANPHPWDSIDSYLQTKLDQVVRLLGQQIAIAIALDEKFSAAAEDVSVDLDHEIAEFRERGRELAQRFAERIPEIRELLSTDVRAAYEGDPACRNLPEVILCYPGFRAVTVYRVAHELHLMGVPLLPRMMSEWVHGATGIDIHPGARIGRHFFVDHGTGVVIGETCVIGEHVKIYQGVTLGAISFPTDGSGSLVRDTKRHPTIQDNVIIYANATVLGGRTVIGHDSVIGSSVWLTRSVDPFTTIVMEKPRLHLRDETPDSFRPPIDYQI